MRLAITASARGLGATSPNPPVGCVILDRHGDIVGIGHHERKGEAHAEGHALAEAGGRARGGTAVVTLEPCNHVGHTPACRQLLIDAGIVRVVVSMIDPTSRDGGGVAALRAAGVQVETGVLTEETALVLGPWLDSLGTRLPYVVAAYRLDGQGIRPVDRQAVGLVLQCVDVVLEPDGRVLEAIPGRHGPGMLDLPVEPMDDRPALDLLGRLHAGGVRSVLLSAPDRMEQFTAAGLVDRLIVEVASEADVRTGASLLVAPGLRIAQVVRSDSAVRLEYLREARSQFPPPPSGIHL